MQDPAQSRRLAETMVRLGNDAGVTTRALITAMDVPLGLAVGNAIEVQESVDVLAGGGPADVIELTILLASEMLDLAGLHDVDPADTLQDGRAMDVWNRMIRAQGGDPSAALPRARETEVIRAQADGVVTRMDALSIGVAAWRLGAGRARKEDPVSAGAGVLLHAKPGDPVRVGEPLLTLLTDEPGRFSFAHQVLDGAVEVGAPGSTIERLPLVVGRVD
jgi:thymidine phosphorylase